MATLAVLQQRLAEAQQAEHDIMTGTSVRRFIDQNGESVEYSRANINQLQAYIRKLEQQIRDLQNSVEAYRGPIKFRFGARPRSRF